MFRATLHPPSILPFHNIFYPYSRQMRMFRSISFPPRIFQVMLLLFLFPCQDAFTTISALFSAWIWKHITLSYVERSTPSFPCLLPTCSSIFGRTAYYSLSGCHIDTAINYLLSLFCHPTPVLASILRYAIFFSFTLNTYVTIVYKYSPF